MSQHYRRSLGLLVGVGFGGKSERNKSLTGSVFFVVSGRVRRFLRRCSVGVRFRFGVPVNRGVAVADAAVASGVAVTGSAASSGVALGNTTGRGVSTIGTPTVGKVSRVGLCARNWAIPEIIATATETIPKAIAQRARR